MNKPDDQADAAPAEPAGPGPALSRLMDDDLGEFELRRLLQDESPEMRATWARYQVAGAVLRGERPDGANEDISRRIRDALREEQAPEGAGLVLPDAGGRSRWGGMAIAASVALAVIFLVRFIDSGSSQAPVPAVAQVPVPETSVARTVPAVPGQPEIIRARGSEVVRAPAHRPPNKYLVRHAEFSTFAGRGGMMPYARVAGTEAAD